VERDGVRQRAMGKRLGSTVREDNVDNLLDRLAVMREEILAIERSLERIQDAKLEQGKDGSGKDGV
jgi:pilus assembly protein TadC